MRRRIGPLVAAAVLAAALVPLGGSAQARDNCKDGTLGGAAGTPSARGQITLEVGQYPNSFYVNVREIMGDTYTYSVWVYQESNGLAELQRGGGTENSVTPWKEIWEAAGHATDSCQESTKPDAIIF